MKKIEISKSKNTLIPLDFSGGKGLLATMEGFTYGPNLIRNGGASGETDFLDSNGDGLADYFSMPYNDTPTTTLICSIVTGNGFTGNAQRAVKSGSTWAGLYYLINLAQGKRYRIKGKYRSDSSTIAIRERNNSTSNALYTFTSNIGNANTFDIEIVITLSGCLGLFIDFANTSNGKYFEVDEWELKEVLVPDNSGLRNNLNVYGSPTRGYLGSLPAIDNRTSGTQIKTGTLPTNQKVTDSFTFIQTFLMKTNNVGHLLNNSNNAYAGFSLVGYTDSNKKIGVCVGDQTAGNTLAISADLTIPTVVAGTYVKPLLNVWVNGVKNSKTLSSGNITYADIISVTGRANDGNSPAPAMLSLSAIIPKVLTDTEIQSLSQKLLFLATNIGMWSSQTGVSSDKTDTNFLGVYSLPNGDISSIAGTALITGSVADYYNSTSKIIYAPLPINSINSTVRGTAIDGTDLYVIGDDYLSRYNSLTGFFEERKAVTSGKAVSVGDGMIAKADGVNCQMMYVEYKGMKYTQEGLEVPVGSKKVQFEDLTDGMCFYLGDKNTDGSWRILPDASGNLLHQKRVAGVWVTKETILGA